ncbi:hypothetical protein ACFXI8_27100 [Streptomyces niveus]|uniref:hypothetical protein n=1 Tax=Streptomyces niveus TaxID=193462 RepID=UPI0036741BF4
MTVLAYIFLSFGLFGAGLVPWLLLVNADDLNPWHHARPAVHRAQLTVAALLLILGGHRAR